MAFGADVAAEVWDPATLTHNIPGLVDRKADVPVATVNIGVNARVNAVRRTLIDRVSLDPVTIPLIMAGALTDTASTAP